MAYQNFYATKLQTSISSSDTSIDVQVPPSVTAGRLVIDPRNSTQREIISFTGVSGSTLTGVTRGEQGTTAQAHSSGVLVEMNVTADDIQDIYDAFDSFSASANDWRTVTGTPVIASTNGQKEFVVNAAADVTGSITKGTRIKIPRTSSVPTQMMQFVGSSSQFASKASPAGIAFTTAFTVEAWVHLDDVNTNSNYCIIGRRDSTHGWSLRIDIRGRVNLIAGNGSFDVLTSVASVPIGEDIHIAAGMDVSAGTGAIYINGILVASTYTNSASTNLSQPSVDLVVGKETIDTTYLTAKLADIRVWSVVRTQAQVRDNMHKQLVGSETNLVIYYKGNGDFNDSTSNANNLTAQAGAIATFAGHPFKATEYGIVTKVGAYAAGVTPLTIFTGLDHSIPNETLGTLSYSNARTPFGFPNDSGRWIVWMQFTGSGSSGVATGSIAGAWGAFTGADTLLPIGAWHVSGQGVITGSSSTSASFTLQVQLDTASPTGTYDRRNQSVSRANTAASFIVHKHIGEEDFVFTAATTVSLYAAITNGSGTQTAYVEDKFQYNVIARCNYL